MDDRLTINESTELLLLSLENSGSHSLIFLRILQHSKLRSRRRLEPRRFLRQRRVTIIEERSDAKDRAVGSYQLTKDKIAAKLISYYLKVKSQLYHIEFVEIGTK